MKAIDILCPVYKEEAGIAAFNARLQGVVSRVRARYRVRIIYALDPAPDATEQILRSIAEADSDVEVLVMSRRFGHQAALLAGIDACRCDALIMLDSDGQHPPELIPQLIDRWEAGADIVQTLRQDAGEAGWLKRATSRWFYRVLQGIGTIQLRSGAADYRLLGASVIGIFQRELRERNPFVRGLVAWVGYNICYVPFAPEQRAAGVSHYRASTLINFALHGICSFSKAPLRAGITAGLLIAAASVLGGLVELAVYLSGSAQVPGWASLFAALSFLSGVQILFLGLLGEYVGLIFDEVKARPRYLVRARYRANGEVPKSPAEGTESE